MKKHNQLDAVASLNKKNDIRVFCGQIFILSDKVFNPKTNQTEDNPNRKNDIGKGSWGKIDYLLSLGYWIQRISTFKNLQIK